jgi:hypothetical protein
LWVRSVATTQQRGFETMVGCASVEPLMAVFLAASPLSASHLAGSTLEEDAAHRAGLLVAQQAVVGHCCAQCRR